MSPKYLRRERALACPIHQAVKDKAMSLLAARGFFSKDEILEDLRYQAIEDSIRWDYVKEFIEEDTGRELVPVAPRFFRTSIGKGDNRVSIKQDRLTKPERYLAGGHGKKTAGYCSVATEEGMGLVVKKLENMSSVIKGVMESHERTRREAIRVLPATAHVPPKLGIVELPVQEREA